MAGSRQPRGGRSIGYVLKIVLVVVLLGAVAWLAADRFILGGGRGGTAITAETIQMKLKDISELATQAGYFTSVQEISGRQKIFGLKVPFTQSKYIYSYDGVVKAGIDFDQVTAAVDREAKLVTISLPAPKILSANVFEDTLKVYEEKKNVFTPLKISDLNQANEEMKNEASKKAVENGILENARSNAETLISAFVGSMFPDDGWEIRFIWADEYGR